MYSDELALSRKKGISLMKCGRAPQALPSVVLQHCKVDEHPFLIYLFTLKERLHREVVTVKVLALAMIRFQPVCGRKRVFTLSINMNTLYYLYFRRIVNMRHVDKRDPRTYI